MTELEELDQSIERLCNIDEFETNKDRQVAWIEGSPEERLFTIPIHIPCNTEEHLIKHGDFCFGFKNCSDTPIIITIKMFPQLEWKLYIDPYEIAPIFEGYPLPLLCLSYIYIRFSIESDDKDAVDIETIFGNLLNPKNRRALALTPIKIRYNEGKQWFGIRNGTCGVDGIEDTIEEYFEIRHKKYERDVGYVLK
jgi:hypothetical protein